jgi:hypothetical protein
MRWSALASDGMPALALTDLANVFGLVKFYSSARGKGIKPLLGSDVFIANDSRSLTVPIDCCCWCVRGRATGNCASCCRAPTWRHACADAPRSAVACCTRWASMV